MALPDFSHLPDELRQEVLKQAPETQQVFARLKPEQIRKILMATAEAAAMADTADLTPEELAMGSEAFLRLCIERSQAMKRERQEARARAAQEQS